MPITSMLLSELPPGILTPSVCLDLPLHAATNETLPKMIQVYHELFMKHYSRKNISYVKIMYNAVHY